MASHPDVLIIGGGVIGLTCAYVLRQKGRTVTVVDAGDMGKEASWAGAGIIPPGDPKFARSPIDKLRAIGALRFPELSQELYDETGIDNGYRRCGGIEFLGEGERFLADEWKAEGVRVDQLTPDEVTEREPNLASLEGDAYELPDMAQVRNPRHLRALLTSVKQRGVELRPHLRVMKLDHRGHHIQSAVLGSGERLSADRFLIAAGAWSEGLLQPLGISFGVHPVRGQIVMFRGEKPPLTRIIMRDKRYLVPRDDGRTLAGSTEEPEAGFLKANTSEAIHELTRLAYDWVPSLRETDVERTWAGIRPGSSDGLPVIGPVSDLDNLYINAGHFRAGIQLSIGSADLLAAMLEGTAAESDRTFFRPDRVPRSDYHPTFRS